MMCTTETSEEVLERARVLWYASRESYRDSTIEVGNILHEYVLHRIREAEHLPEYRRLKFTRQEATADAARGLNISRHRVNELICVAQTASLLGSGGLGDLSYISVRAFRILVRRGSGGRRGAKIRRSPPSGDVLPGVSVREQWQVRPEVDGEAQALFARAVRDGWQSKRCREEVEKVAWSLPGRRRGHLFALHPEDHGPQSLRQMAANSSPRDLVDMITSLVEYSSDPNVVSSLVVDRLGKLKPNKVFVG